MASSVPDISRLSAGSGTTDTAWRDSHWRSWVRGISLNITHMPDVVVPSDCAEERRRRATALAHDQDVSCARSTAAGTRPRSAARCPDLLRSARYSASRPARAGLWLRQAGGMRLPWIVVWVIRGRPQRASTSLRAPRRLPGRGRLPTRSRPPVAPSAPRRSPKRSSRQEYQGSQSL